MEINPVLDMYDLLEDFLPDGYMDQVLAVEPSHYTGFYFTRAFRFKLLLAWFASEARA
jgi:hypothetical protein